MTLVTRRRALKLGALLVMLGACGPSKPEAIAYGADQCAYCRMQISDPRFGAELLTVRGRSVKFDSIECMIAFYKQAASANDVASLWVSDFLHPGTLVDARNARFVDLGPGRAPMGRGWAAVASDADAARLATDGRPIKQWSDLL